MVKIHKDAKKLLDISNIESVINHFELLLKHIYLINKHNNPRIPGLCYFNKHWDRFIYVTYDGFNQDNKNNKELKYIIHTVLDKSLPKKENKYWIIDNTIVDYLEPGSTRGGFPWEPYTSEPRRLFLIELISELNVYKSTLK